MFFSPLTSDHCFQWFSDGFGVTQPSPVNDFHPPYHWFQWFSVVMDHWSNDAMVSMNRSPLADWIWGATIIREGIFSKRRQSWKRVGDIKTREKTSCHRLAPNSKKKSRKERDAEKGSQRRGWRRTCKGKRTRGRGNIWFYVVRKAVRKKMMINLTNDNSDNSMPFTTLLSRQNC